MQDLIAKAATLLEALPYIQKFSGATFVIKYGGSFMDSPDPNVRHSVARDIVFLEAVEINPVIVHGGGKAITRAMEKAGSKPSFVQGQRVTEAFADLRERNARRHGGRGGDGLHVRAGISRRAVAHLAVLVVAPTPGAAGGVEAAHAQAADPEMVCQQELVEVFQWPGKTRLGEIDFDLSITPCRRRWATWR